MGKRTPAPIAERLQAVLERIEHDENVESLSALRTLRDALPP